MSYDIYLEPPKLSNIEVGNYTFNICPMFNLAFDCDYWVDAINGKSALDAAIPIGQAIICMEADPDKFRKLNPINGWGDYNSALDFLKKFRMYCFNNLTYRVRIDR